jgi:hypothetical protein
VGEVALSRDRIAFSLYATSAARVPVLYAARLDGEESRIASGEIPLGWTRAGALLTLSIRGGVLRARSTTGSVERTIARRVSGEAFLGSRRVVFFVARQKLGLFDGTAVRQLGTLYDYGLSARTSLIALHDHLVLADAKRLVVLGSDGSLLSSTALPRPANAPHSRASTLSGALAESANGTIAFTATRGDGFEDVYLLPAGTDAASMVYREAVTYVVCEHTTQLAWRGSWLLYSASEGYAAAINTPDPATSLDLSALMHRMPDIRGGIDAIWQTRT